MAGFFNAVGLAITALYVYGAILSGIIWAGQKVWSALTD